MNTCACISRNLGFFLTGSITVIIGIMGATLLAMAMTISHPISFPRSLLEK